ncbi:hypothetical protein GCM10010251_76540 [Streptomyces aurantiogriseus]|uniref:Uncharacterized protein n=1 Tax=Streptomyces aurantiogriseus TaxID=66870 RepID=A0A918FKY9_9ACTN|nr:hypothetical protein GCM10010251_76540 [Streptomyces aurantiogriseus]
MSYGHIYENCGGASDGARSVTQEGGSRWLPRRIRGGMGAGVGSAAAPCGAEDGGAVAAPGPLAEAGAQQPLNGVRPVPMRPAVPGAALWPRKILLGYRR